MKKWISQSTIVACLSLLLSAPPGWGESVSLTSAYLSGNHANYNNDYEAAVRYYSQAISKDPKNPYLLQNALLAAIAKGDMSVALAVSHQITNNNVPSELNSIVHLVEMISREDFAAADAYLNQTDSTLNSLMAGLTRGWVQLGLGRMSDAQASFETMKDPAIFDIFGKYHKALAMALVGDFESADTLLKGDDRGNLRLNRGSLVAHAQILSQIGKTDEALTFVKAAQEGTSDAGLAALQAQLEKGEAVPFDFITSAKEGVAEVLFSIGSIYSEQQDERYALLNSRLAAWLNPGHVEAILLTAEVLQKQGQFNLANQAYAKVPENHPLYLNAEMGRAEALEAADKPDAAVEVLNGLARRFGDVLQIHLALGDSFRSQEEFDKAAHAYDRAAALIEKPLPVHWFLYYARGISHERTDSWVAAEADFRKALELFPDQPLVLNYLGYSLVEKNLKLDEAQAMIEKAVATRPDDGFITDSLGWVLYRVGKFEEAVAPMERAVELVPDDPIINDHFGDVLWMVDRKLEARFQWRRAMSFEPEEKDLQRIRRKLEVGLDEVLTQEEQSKVTSN